MLTLGVAFAAAWFGKDIYVSAVMDAEVDGIGVRALLKEAAAEMPALAGVIESLAEMIIGVVTILASTPVAVLMTPLSVQYGKSDVLPSKSIFISTVLSVLTMPAIIWLLL